MKHFLFVVIIMWTCSSCFEIPNPFDDTEDIVYPDTTVAINSLMPQICEVTISDTDSTYHVTSYWTDELTGRIIYKMEDQPYTHSRLHGTQYRYDEDGDTLLIAHFEHGVRIDSTVYYYDNGSPKHKFFYSKKKDGNILFEQQFHPSGYKKTDMVQYENGVLNGKVDYYKDQKRPLKTETFYYREGELIGIKIYNKDYDDLDNRFAQMYKEYRADSIRLADEVLALVGDEGDGGDIPVFYGTAKDAMYDVGEVDDWDIMKIDPVFMLKYYNR